MPVDYQGHTVHRSNMSPNRRTVALVLGLLGAALLIIGALAWRAADDDTEADRIAASFERAILLDQGEADLAAVDIDPEPERTLPVIVLVLGVVGVVAAVVLVARERSG